MRRRTMVRVAMQNESHRKKMMKNIIQRIWDRGHSEKVKHTFIEVSQGEEAWNKTEAIFEELMAENFPKRLDVQYSFKNMKFKNPILMKCQKNWGLGGITSKEWIVRQTANFLIPTNGNQNAVMNKAQLEQKENHGQPRILYTARESIKPCSHLN